MNPTQSLDRAQRFFFDNAPWCHATTEPPAVGRTRGAIALAAAEQLFFDAGVEFRVEADDQWGENGEPLYVMSIRCEDGYLASLGGIDDDGATHTRVIRAELALECSAFLAQLVEHEKH